MFEQLFKRPYYVNRHINAPFLEERSKYIQYLTEKGLTISRIRDTAQYLLRVIEFLDLETRQVASLEEIDQAAEKWAKHQSNHPQKRRKFSESAKEMFTTHAIHWLKMINRLTTTKNHNTIIDKIFERGAALRRHAYAPLLEERLLYLQYWSTNGSPESELKRIAQYQLVIMEHLNFYKVRIVTRDEIKTAADRWARIESSNKRKMDHSKFARDRFIKDAIHWFKMLECLEKEPKVHFPFEVYLDEYILYMRHEQGLSEATIKVRRSLLKDFLINVSALQNVFSEITPLILDTILIKKYERDGYCRKTIQEYTSIVRSFLRYAESKNWCQKNLASCLKAPRVYQNESLPYSPGWEDVKKIIDNCNSDHPTDIRDRAVLMLLSVYGLRCSEVAHLCLEDFDWKNELLHLRRAKNSKPQTFPLSKTIGNAILVYIQQVRPNRCQPREIFLCRRAPYRRLTSSCIYNIVSKQLKPLNLKIKHHGPHALRHACATHLINDGVSLKEISDHLGHQGLNTTRVYAKVDLVNLRKVAEFEIGDLL